LADRFLAEKPKVGELQMDWLRSEDLKEEEDVTAPTLIVAGTSDQN
jgi:alpha-beta hydrolase superfamily lysophospholipase